VLSIRIEASSDSLRPRPYGPSSPTSETSATIREYLSCRRFQAFEIFPDLLINSDNRTSAMIRKIILTAAASLIIASYSAKADGLKFNDLSPEEQALYDKGYTMEDYQPNEHSRHEIVYIEATGRKRDTDSRKRKLPNRSQSFV
jgi:hypothetical protein